jgi:putative ABC transport system substrate-binding protein
MNPRRQLLLVLCAFVAGGRIAAAAGPPRVGILNFGAVPAPDGAPEPIVRHLRALGYVEGTNIEYERRYAAGDRDRYPALAAELLRSKVDLIFAAGSDISRAFLRSAPRVPVVFIASDDPVESGLVQSLARPGGLFTGVSLMSPELGGKRLELMKETMPGLRRVAVMYDQHHEFYLTQMHPPAAQLGVEIVALKFDGADEFASVFAAAKGAGADAMFVAPNRYTLVYAARIAALSVENRLPAVSAYDAFARAGGLLSYGPIQDDASVRAAAQIDRILRGASPLDLPVERMARIALVVNLRTARALGITIPQSLLLRADEVIQ